MTLTGIRLRTCRCDCSFVLAAPMHTLVGELHKSVAGVWERVPLPSPKALFSRILSGWYDSQPALVAALKTACDAGELVGRADHDNVPVSSGVQSIEPGSNRYSFPQKAIPEVPENANLTPSLKNLVAMLWSEWKTWSFKLSKY